VGLLCGTSRIFKYISEDFQFLMVHEWFGRLIIGLLGLKPSVFPRTVHATFIVDEETQGKDFLPAFGLYAMLIIPPQLHTYPRLHSTLIERRSGRSVGTLKQSDVFFQI
jgi:hypothetical protein